MQATRFSSRLLSPEQKKKHELLQTLLRQQKDKRPLRRKYLGHCARCNVSRSSLRFQKSGCGAPLPPNSTLLDLPYLSEDNYRLCSKCYTALLHHKVQTKDSARSRPQVRHEMKPIDEGILSNKKIIITAQRWIQAIEDTCDCGGTWNCIGWCEEGYFVGTQVECTQCKQKKIVCNSEHTPLHLTSPHGKGISIN
jgi:hypothetical protein